MKLRSALLAIPVLAGCARDDAAYPSLAARAAEERGFAEPAVVAPPPATADPALDAKLAGASGRLDVIVKGFAADLARAEQASGAAGAGKVGSEGWVAAQTALAALDDGRAQTGAIVTELDGLARERIASTGAPYPALDALRARADADATRQAEAIARVGAKLPAP